MAKKSKQSKFPEGWSSWTLEQRIAWYNRPRILVSEWGGVSDVYMQAQARKRRVIAQIDQARRERIARLDAQKALLAAMYDPDPEVLEFEAALEAERDDAPVAVPEPAPEPIPFVWRPPRRIAS